MSRPFGFMLFGCLLVVAICCGGTAATSPLDEERLSRVEPAVRSALQEGLTAVEIDPSAANWGELADRLLSHGFEAEAADCYRRALKQAGQSAERFEWQYLLGIATGSAEEFKVATTLRPDQPLSWLRLGLAEQTAANHLEASEAFREAIVRDTQLQRAHRGLGQSLLALEQPTEAIEPLQRALELDRRDVAAWSALAQSLTALGENDQARVAAEQGRFATSTAGFEDPLWVRHILEKGVSRSRRIERAQRAVAKSDWAGAQSLLSGLREERQDDADVEFLTAIVAASRGEFDSAETAFARCLDIQPDHLRAMLSRSQLYERRGEFELALEWIETASRISPRDPSIAMARMRNRRAAQDLEGLLLAIDQMLALNPGVTELEELREATAAAIASTSNR